MTKMKVLLLSSLLLLVGCESNKPHDPKFRYEQRVKVVGGFFAGRKGEITAHLEYSNRYLIKFDGTPYFEIIEERHLAKNE